MSSLLLLSLLLCSLCLVVAGVFCPSLPTGYGLDTGTSDFIITPDTRNRTFIVYLPPNYTPGVTVSTGFPLVFFFHGGLGSAANAMNKYGMNDIARSNNFIIVYPQGIGLIGSTTSWNAGGGCCGPAATLNVNDVGFTSQLLTRMSTLFCVDPNAVFSTGMSNGAIFSQRLACDQTFNENLAAIAPVEGTIPPSTSCSGPPPGQPGVSVMEVQGWNDSNVRYEGGFGCGISGVNFTGIPYSINTWTSLFSCQYPFSTYGLTAPSSTQLDATRYDYGPCARGVDVQLVMISGEGHAWSGVSDQIDFPNCTSTAGQWPASYYVWNFFNTHRKPQSSSSSTAGAGNSSHHKHSAVHFLWLSLVVTATYILLVLLIR